MPRTATIVQLTITLLCLGIGAVFLFKFKDDLHLILEITPAQLALFLALAVLTILITGSKMRLILRAGDIRIPFREWFGLTAILLTLNSLFFKTGSLVTTMFLKKNYGFPHSRYVGTFGADQIVQFFTSASIGLTISIYLGQTRDPRLHLLTTLFLAILLALYLIMKLTPDFHSERRFLEILARVTRGAHEVLKNHALFRNLALHAIALSVVIALRIFLSGQVLHLHVPFSHCLLFTVAITFVRALPMLQSDLGIREMVIGLLSDLLGAGWKEGFLLTVVDRIFVLLFCFLASTLFATRIFRPGNNLQPETGDR
jgi:uncharacterized membrane protein YbhN (UPF0104 family)